MQKKLIASALLGLLSSYIPFAHAAPFTGFYGDVAIGYMNAKINTANAIAIDVPMLETLRFNNSPTLGATSMTGGLGLGFSDVIKQNFLLGIEGRANVESLSNTFHDLGSNLHTNGPFSLPSTLSVKLKNDFAFLVKFGITPDTHVLIYALIGPSWGNTQSSSNTTFFQSIPAFPLTASAAVTGHQSGYTTGLLGGLGIEYLITQQLSLAMEFTYVNYGNINFPTVSAPVTLTLPVTSGQTLTDTHKINLKTNNTTLRLTYYLG